MNQARVEMTTSYGSGFHRVRATLSFESAQREGDSRVVSFRTVEEMESARIALAEALDALAVQGIVPDMREVR